MKKKNYSIIILLCSFLNYPRSPFRKIEKNIPTVTTVWSDGGKSYTRTSRYFHESPLFSIFEKKHFDAHVLPNRPITYRWNENVTVDGSVISQLIETLYKEVEQKKHKYTHFKILQTKNFNRHRKCGLLVVKFKNYPFVVKLFLETPKSLTDPYCKGFENRVFHFMGHGANRHLSGLTRIPNLEYLMQLIKESDTWRNRIILPRKWYWKPKNERWINVTGKQFAYNNTLQTSLPGIYAIIADELDTSIKSSISMLEHHNIVLNLCNEMKLMLDPHLDNFILDFRDAGPFKIHIVDTEHFPTIVGIHKSKKFSNYIQWYGYLSCKAFNDMYLQTKKQRIEFLYTPIYFPWQTNNNDLIKL